MVNEDTQRALAALNSREAEAAFAAGGGGRCAGARRGGCLGGDMWNAMGLWDER